MEEKIKRQKIWERDNIYFSYEDKYEIGEKSDHKCCHCGTQRFPDYGATIDHFVPLIWGGKSIKDNLIMLCEDCNKEKKDKIYEPQKYLKHLKPEHKENLLKYFDSFTRGFEFFERRNLLACDRYSYEYTPEVVQNIRNAKNRRKIAEKVSLFSVNLDRVDNNNFNKAREYYIKYLKKRDCFTSEKIADLNLDFFMSLGCMYGVWRNKELTALCAATLCHHQIIPSPTPPTDDEQEYSLVLFIMPYYSTTIGYNMASLLVDEIPHLLLKEQGIAYCPIELLTVPSDPFLSLYTYKRGIPVKKAAGLEDLFLRAGILVGEAPSRLSEKEKENTKEFLERFRANIPKINNFFKQPGYEDIYWMKRLVYDSCNADYKNKQSSCMREDMQEDIER